MHEVLQQRSIEEEGKKAGRNIKNAGSITKKKHAGRVIKKQEGI
jgi:hypothetical protein